MAKREMIKKIITIILYIALLDTSMPAGAFCLRPPAHRCTVEPIPTQNRNRHPVVANEIARKQFNSLIFSGFRRDNIVTMEDSNWSEERLITTTAGPCIVIVVVEDNLKECGLGHFPIENTDNLRKDHPEFHKFLNEAADKVKSSDGRFWVYLFGNSRWLKHQETEKVKLKVMSEFASLVRC